MEKINEELDTLLTLISAASRKYTNLKCGLVGLIVISHVLVFNKCGIPTGNCKSEKNFNQISPFSELCSVSFAIDETEQETSCLNSSNLVSEWIV